MGTVIVKIRIMPVSVETDIKEIENKISGLLKKNNTDNYKFEIESIAFGLKALILLFSWPEEKELEKFENELKKVDGVSSIEIVDMRRAIG